MTTKRRKRIVAWVHLGSDGFVGSRVYHTRNAAMNHIDFSDDKAIKLVEADPVRERLIKNLVKAVAANEYAGPEVMELFNYEKGKQ